ncbi:MAG: HDOD domain-containing protein [Gammaproteobacteria bacterium]|nr:HDOD domain-containing protein [Gammaproteobacteria bacterium]
MQSTHPLPAAADPAIGELARRYAQELAAQIDHGAVELPAWSQMTERARAALNDDAVDDEQLARLLAAEAGLAVRVLTIANAAMFAVGGARTADLKLAVMRLGRDCVRSAVYAYALAQLRHAPRLLQVREELRQLWRESTAVATLARLVAAETSQVDPDEALLAGLLHNIGKLALLAQLQQAPAALREPQARVALLIAWHARIGLALSLNWRLPESVCNAIAEQDTLDATRGGGANLNDVLAVAVIGSGVEQDVQQVAGHLAAFSRFGLNAERWCTLLERARLEAAALRAAFGD